MKLLQTVKIWFDWWTSPKCFHFIWMFLFPHKFEWSVCHLPRFNWSYWTIPTCS